MFQQATLENYDQAEMTEWDDQASKYQCHKKVSFENETFWREHFLCLPFEIGSRGYISPLNKANLKKPCIRLAKPVLVSKQWAKIYISLQWCQHTTF